MNRATWMSQYESIVIASIKELEGKIDWDTAVYLYNKGYTPIQAASKTIERHNHE